MSELLLHICCAPCAIFPLSKLRRKGFQVTGYFYNPNIHDFSEYQKRFNCLKKYVQKVKLSLIEEDDYQRELKNYFNNIAKNKYRPKRCEICYEMRLKKTVEKAKDLNIKYFSTTLLVSPYQNQKKIHEVGESLSKKYGPKFYFEDFRKGYAESRHLAKKMNLYRQKYCGCMFSWMEQKVENLRKNLSETKSL